VDPDVTAQAVGGGGRRHPRWGIVAQVTAIVGAVGLVQAMGLMWVVYDSTSGTVNSLLADLDATATEAQGKYDAAGAALDDQADRAVNADAQALFQDGADLVRDVGAQVASVESRIGDTVDSLLSALLVTVGMLTVLLAYLIVIHGGIWTLGRHWRRD
jgi:hypothetical protein